MNRAMRAARNNIIAERQGNGDEVTWTVHPAARSPVKAAAGVMGIGMVVGTVYGFSRDALLSAIGFTVMMISLSPFFQKTVFRIDENGVSRSIWGIKRSLRWSEIRRYNVSNRGVYVTPAGRERWWDHRGIYLMLDENKEAVVAGIRKRLAETEKEDFGSVQG
ncbi:hypothetical protein JXA40_09745 [bacterium]|nr:hypothetical protein [candidate division CSSED10-310 bacterium]